MKRKTETAKKRRDEKRTLPALEPAQLAQAGGGMAGPVPLHVE